MSELLRGSTLKCSSVKRSRFIGAGDLDGKRGTGPLWPRTPLPVRPPPPPVAPAAGTAARGSGRWRRRLLLVTDPLPGTAVAGAEEHVLENVPAASGSAFLRGKTLISACAVGGTSSSSIRL